MSLRQCCVIDNDGVYVDLFSVKTEQSPDGTPIDTVLGYKLAEGERLIDTAPPDKRLHAGTAGFVRPRWDEDVAAWIEGASAEEIAAWEAEHPAPMIDMDALRAAKQEQNKQALADWLATHPLTWTDGKVYGVTEEDQNEMAFNLTKYQLQSSAQVEWHAQKKERHTFTFEQYKALFLAVDSYVDPYRRYQESIKQAIYEANTAEEINAIQIDYSTVGN